MEPTAGCSSSSEHRSARRSRTGAAAAPQSSLDRNLRALAKVDKNLDRLPPKVRERIDRILSAGGARPLTTLNKRAQLAEVALQAQPCTARSGAQALPAQPLPAGEGSDPSALEDFASRLAGNVQSEATVAWCGRNAIVGFNDSGSFVATAFLGASPSGSLSFDGWSYSRHAGVSFTDGGPILADPVPPGLAFFNSASGGRAWEDTVLAVGKGADLHFLDKEWLSVEPGPTAARNDDAIGLQSRIQFDVTAGTTYHLMAGSFDDSPGGTLVLTVQELPPPMELSVDLARTGTVDRRGVATLHGTLTCSRAGSIDLTVGLRQRESIGFAGTTIDCDGTERWRIRVIGETGGFRPGRAFGLAVASFQDPARGEVVTARDDGTVQLRR